MAYKGNIIKSLHSAKGAPAGAAEAESALADLMSDADYLRQSSALINEALQKGFDVLQLANGDIVTTGTKTIVNQYSWDDSKGKLSKTRVSEKKSRKSKDERLLEDLDDEL